MAEAPSITCPVCGGRLGFQTVDGLHIGVCDSCGGSWFGSGQLDSLVKHGQAALDLVVGLEPAGPHTQHADGTAKCPLCNVTLQSTTYQGAAPVHASACYVCGGIFLDADSVLALDAASKQRIGDGSFAHQGSFGARPPVPQGPSAGQPNPYGDAPVPPPSTYGSGPIAPPAPYAGGAMPPPQVHSIGSSLYQNRMYYQQQDPGAGALGALVAVDVVANLLDIFL